jgi:hypothetical protein
MSYLSRIVKVDICVHPKQQTEQLNLSCNAVHGYLTSLAFAKKVELNM